MIKSEAEFSKVIVDLLNDWHNSHAVRVECPDSSPGFPDVNFCINNREGNIELKYCSKEYAPEIRPSQARWMRKRDKAGGNVCYMCLINEEDGDWVYATRDVHNELLQGCIGREIWNETRQGRWKSNEFLAGKVINFLRVL